MLTIGITGGFGTGKSFVASIFRKLGAKVIDADKLAHKALKKGTAVYKRVVKEFGSSILDKKGSIDRKALAGIVFNDKKQLVKLNRIVHPVVIREIKKSIRVSWNRIIVIDAPLICETSLSGIIDILVVVKASSKVQIDRCVRKFRIKEKDVCKRVACQIPLTKKIEKADHVIDNNGTKEKTRREVTRLWQSIKKGANVWR